MDVKKVSYFIIIIFFFIKTRFKRTIRADLIEEKCLLRQRLGGHRSQ